MQLTERISEKCPWVLWTRWKQRHSIFLCTITVPNAPWAVSFEGVFRCSGWVVNKKKKDLKGIFEEKCWTGYFGWMNKLLVLSALDVFLTFPVGCYFPIFTALLCLSILKVQCAQNRQTLSNIHTLILSTECEETTDVMWKTSMNCVAERSTEVNQLAPAHMICNATLYRKR